MAFATLQLTGDSLYAAVDQAHRGVIRIVVRVARTNSLAGRVDLLHWPPAQSFPLEALRWPERLAPAIWMARRTSKPVVLIPVAVGSTTRASPW